MKRIYIILAVLGTALPYYFLIQFIVENGFNLNLLVEMLFTNSISTFFAVDFFISCFVFIIFMFKESKRLNIKKAQWVCLITLCVVGLSLAFPLFLYIRECKLENMEVAG